MRADSWCICCPFSGERTVGVGFWNKCVGSYATG